MNARPLVLLGIAVTAWLRLGGPPAGYLPKPALPPPKAVRQPPQPAGSSAVTNTVAPPPGLVVSKVR